MSFDTLPENWGELPLDDPGLAADVADLVVGDADRHGGCVGILLTHPDLRLAQPCVVNEIGDTMAPEEFGPYLAQLCRLVAESGGAVLFVRGRPGSVLLTDTDRRWHQVAVDTCREQGVRLVGAYLATSSAVRSFPAPLEEVTEVAS